MPADGRESRFGTLAILATALLFSTGGTVIKATALPAPIIAGTRAGLATLTLIAVMRVPLAAFRPVVLLVGAGQALQMSAFVAANKLTTASNAIFLQSTAPIYVALLAPWLLGERLRRRDLGVLAAFALGSVLIFLGQEPARVSAPDPFHGDVLAAISGVFWALTVTGLRRLAAAPGGDAIGSGNEAAAAVIAANAITFLLWLAWLPGLATTPGIGTRDIAALIWLGVFQVGGAYACLTIALRRIRALEASLLLLLEPVLSTIWAALVHGEIPGRLPILGSSIVLLASLAQVLRKSTASRPDPAAGS